MLQLAGPMRSAGLHNNPMGCIMTDEIFREDAPFDFEKSVEGYKVGVPIPSDDTNMSGRSCPSEQCSPRYFKVKLETGLNGVTAMHCPYCRESGEGQAFATEEQARYATDLVKREATKGIHDMLTNMLEEEFGQKSGSRRRGSGMEISLDKQPLHQEPVKLPVEEELRRNLRCPACTLEFSVYGLAAWCPDCAKGMFVDAAQAEFAVIHAALGDVSNRREALGDRVADRDIDNALEDLVSAFEPSVRAMVRQGLIERGRTVKETTEEMRKLGNAFQNVERGSRETLKLLDEDLFADVSDEEKTFLALQFQARHSLTHNSGVVDAKYKQNTGSEEKEGREVRLSVEDVERSIRICLKALTGFGPRIFQDNAG